MRKRYPFDYAIVRVVPRVERGEFLNAGVIVFSSTAAFLRARIELDRARLAALAPDIDLVVVEGHLEVIPKVCAGGAGAGPIGGLAQRQRFHWLVAPRSTIIQTSPVHSGVHHDLDAALQGLFDRFVRAPKSG
jgi:molybdopterin-guanine dinucleotide biosynthesis protein